MDDQSKTELGIYVFYFKNSISVPLDPYYHPLMAGKALSQANTNLPGDDTGDNISVKNSYFSELTGIYWVWKNRKHEITGSCHYRRFFTAKPEPLLYKIKRLAYLAVGLHKKRTGLIYTSNIDYFKERILSETEINEIFKDFDAILPQKRVFRYSIGEHYRRYHDIRDLELVRTILHDKCPQYIPAFDKVIQSRQLYANNMFIMKREHYSQFMEWWFYVLFEIEKKIQLKLYQGYQQRIMGFLAERLLNVYFMHNNLNVKELQLIYFKKIKTNEI